MIEYAHCIYTTWATKHTAEYCRNNEAEFLTLCSHLLKYSPAEIHERLANEPWYLTHGNDT